MICVKVLEFLLPMVAYIMIKTKVLLHVKMQVLLTILYAHLSYIQTLYFFMSLILIRFFLMYTVPLNVMLKYVIYVIMPILIMYTLKVMKIVVRSQKDRVGEEVFMISSKITSM